MKPAPFTYHRPATLAEALDLLADLAPDAKLLAGGQSLGPMLNMRLASPAHLVDINDLSEFSRIRQAGDWLEVGALARHHELADSELLQNHCPLLAQAAQTIGHYAIRQRGTLGGSLANADPVAQLALVAVTLDARLKLVRRGAEREVSARDFLRSAMTTSLAPQELLLSVRFPRSTGREASALRIFNRRHGDYAIVAAAVNLRLQDGQVSQLRLGVSGVAPVPLRLDEVSQRFEHQRPDARWREAVALACAQAVEPEEDERIPSVYRRELTQTLVARALGRALEKLEQAANAGAPPT